MMKILTTRQVREADEYTIKNEPVSSVDLMERAAGAISGWIAGSYPVDTVVKIFSGSGNNGGDGLALGRLLLEAGFKPEVFLLKPGSGGYSPDTAVNLERLEAKNHPPVIIATPGDFPPVLPSDVVVDALFGTGLSRPLEGLPAQLVEHLNSSGADIIAVDIPSGLFGDDNRDNPGGSIVNAKYTLTFQFPKLSFFFPENGRYTGEWIVLPIGLHEGFINETETPYRLINRELVIPLLKKRGKFSHKGNFGHCLLISGSYGKMGAAVLAATACLRSGTGLLTVHVPAKGCEILQACLPEAMISIDDSDHIFSVVPDLAKYDAIGVGPALGTQESSKKALRRLLASVDRPLVMDADAINILSLDKELLEMLPAGSILTPHPGEFDRLTSQHKTGHDRLLTQIEMARKNKIIIVLKGAHTSVAEPRGNCYFNSTGNPGMATGGTGDVLTGIILSLLGQGYKPPDAALTGVYLHGLAGDYASREHSPESMIAGDITSNLGRAFKFLKQ
jgi:ADP-dependent NAD(P)H-hydrate dehydratase / NAD(P)H-hydrate epimerase